MQYDTTSTVWNSSLYSWHVIFCSFTIVHTMCDAFEQCYARSFWDWILKAWLVPDGLEECQSVGITVHLV